MLLAPLLITLFLLIMLGFYVLVGAPRSRPHQMFALFVACLALWTVKDIVLWGFLPDGPVAWWAGGSFAIALVLQYSLVVFAWVFPENKPVPFRRAAVVFAPGAVLLPAVLAGLLWRSVSLRRGVFSIDLTPLGYVYVLYVYGVFAYGFGLLYAKYRYYRRAEIEASRPAAQRLRATSFRPEIPTSFLARLISRWRGGPLSPTSGMRAQQLGALLWALTITGLLKTAANLALPYFGHYELLHISAVFVLPGVFIYAYAISNFKLFSLQSALDQFRLFPIAYKVALSIAVVALVSFALLQVPIVWWAFADGPTNEAWRRYLVFSVITALAPNLLLVALVIRTISRPLRRVTEAAVAVAGGNYGAQVDLRSNDEVGLLAASFNEMSRKMAADIERLRALNEHLIRAEKLAAAGTLAAGVAHEVNNPLAAISSLIQMLQTRPDTGPDTRETLALAQAQITRITQVLRDMMDFAGARPPERQPLDLNRTVEAGLRLASFDQGFQKVVIETDLAAALPPVAADAGQLQQVLLNLFFNARDAMPGGGTLHVRTRYDADAREAVIEISDDGPGIPPAHRAHIFDPFFTTKPAGAGTGLGLAVCYSIVTAHGGRIVVGHGARGASFHVILPIIEQFSPQLPNARQR
jgi:signal transduction histidine kinase